MSKITAGSDKGFRYAVETTNEEAHIASTPLNTADPIQFGAEEYWLAMKVLDDMGVPRAHNEIMLSLVGRIKKATNTFEE